MHTVFPAGSNPYSVIRYHSDYQPEKKNAVKPDSCFAGNSDFQAARRRHLYFNKRENDTQKFGFYRKGNKYNRQEITVRGELYSVWLAPVFIFRGISLSLLIFTVRCICENTAGGLFVKKVYETACNIKRRVLCVLRRDREARELLS